jgi:hypothetical protein
MKNYISKILIVSGILMTSLFVVDFVSAAYPTYRDCVSSTWTTPVGCDKVLDAYYAGFYSDGYEYGHTTRQYSYNQYPSGQPGTPIINNYYHKTSPVTTSSTSTSSTSTTTTKAKTTASSTNNNKVASNVKTSSANNTLGVNENTGYQNFNSFDSNPNRLTALSFRGSGGFLPSSVWQWLIVIFLILMIIIVARLISKPYRYQVRNLPAH